VVQSSIRKSTNTRLRKRHVPFHRYTPYFSIYFRGGTSLISACFVFLEGGRIASYASGEEFTRKRPGTSYVSAVHGTTQRAGFDGFCGGCTKGWPKPSVSTPKPLPPTLQPFAVGHTLQAYTLNPSPEPSTPHLGERKGGGEWGTLTRAAYTPTPNP